MIQVAILEINETTGDATAEELNRKFGSGACAFIKCDVTASAHLEGSVHFLQGESSAWEGLGLQVPLTHKNNFVSPQFVPQAHCFVLHEVDTGPPRKPLPAPKPTMVCAGFLLISGSLTKLYQTLQGAQSLLWWHGTHKSPHFVHAFSCVAECYEAVEKSLGHVDLVVNNAGISDEVNWREMVDVNLVSESRIQGSLHSRIRGNSRSVHDSVLVDPCRIQVRMPHS